MYFFFLYSGERRLPPPRGDVRQTIYNPADVTYALLALIFPPTPVRHGARTAGDVRNSQTLGRDGAARLLAALQATAPGLAVPPPLTVIAVLPSLITLSPPHLCTLGTSGFHFANNGVPRLDPPPATMTSRRMRLCR